MAALWFPFITFCSFASMGAALYHAVWVVRQQDLPQEQRNVAKLIKKCSKAYLVKSITTLMLPIVGGAFLLTVLFNSITIAVALFCGSAIAALSGLVGMAIAVRANSRTTQAASQEDGLKGAFQLAFRAGAVMGLSVVGSSLLGTVVFWFLFQNLTVLWGYGLGASFVALLSKVGGGVYTKAADVGADLAGKLQARLEEDDPRNPAVIADLVGDNVGDVAGQAADIGDSFIQALLAALSRGIPLGYAYILLPFLIAAMGIIASLFGLSFARMKGKDNPTRVINRVTLTTSVFFAIATLGAALMLGFNIGYALCCIAGTATLSLIGFTSTSYTAINGKAVKEVAEASQQGAAFCILAGIEKAKRSLVLPMLGICTTFLISKLASSYFALDTVYAIAMTAVGMLAPCGITVTADAFGPIVDNADGIGQMLGLNGMVTRVTSILDATGNSVKAVTKALTVGAAVLSIIALLLSYCQSADINLRNALTEGFFIGAFLGGLMPQLFTAYLFAAVSKNARLIAKEAERHLILIGVLQPEQATPEEEIPQNGFSIIVNAVKKQLFGVIFPITNRVKELLEQNGILKRPDETEKSYLRCVTIATEGAMKALIKPGCLAIFTPILIGFLFGKYTLCGFLFGSVLVSSTEALFQANVGAIWDNAKKYVEAGYLGGKGSPTHDATIVGDTVGDPHKDSSGPSLNTLLAVILYIANLIAPLVATHALLTL